jgi:hypothetical protein
MKNIKNILLILSVFAVASCDNTLNLAPEDSLTPTIIFSTEALAGNAVNGMYSTLQSSNTLSGIPDTMSEWQADNVEFVGSFPTFDEIYAYNTLSDNTSILAVWNAHYLTINQANQIIKNVPLVPGADFTVAKKNDLIGQARFVRALMHFKLSQLFGKQLKQDPTGNSLSVPVVLEPYDGNVQRPVRNTLKEVYTAIENDLLFAKASITNTAKSRATVAAANALLARLYLYQERFPEAATAANAVIGTSGISFAANYTFYNNPSTEHIFQVQNVAGDNGFAESFSNLYSPTAFGGRGDAPFSTNLIAAFAAQPGDLRYTTLTRAGVDAKSRNSVFTTKYPNGVSNQDDPNVLRVSEMYLIRAEAVLRGATPIPGVTPLDDVNRIRTRASLAPLLTVNLTQILEERRKEFCFEGLRRMDLLRNNLPLRSATMDNFAKSQPTADKVVFPIPQRERDNNVNLAQNTGY